MVENLGIIPEVIVVDATVAGVTEFRGKMRISLTIPAFKSDYATNCTDFPDGMDRAVGVGDRYRMELRRQNRKPGKGDGSKPFHYYWGINGRSEEPVTMFAQVPSQTSGSGDGLRHDPAGISIERQTAYKGVIEIYVAKMNNGHLSGGDMLTLWEDIARNTETAATLVHGGPVAQETPEGAAEEAHEDPQQEGFDNLGSTSTPADGEIGNLGDFMERAQQGGHGYSAAILQKLGVKKPVEILEQYDTFDAAWKVLVKP